MKRLTGIFLLMLACSAGLMAQNKKPAPAKAAGGASAKPSVAKGKVVYTTYCLACHQADGTGVPNMNPPLVKTSWVLGEKTKLIKVLLNGLNEETEINGNTYSNPMPPHNFLSDEDIANVLSFVRTSFTNKTSLVTTAEVKKVRDAGAK